VFKKKYAISGVRVSPKCAETLVRRGGKINYHPIAYSLGDISAKSYQSRLMYVEVIACHGSVVFGHSAVVVHGGGSSSSSSSTSPSRPIVAVVVVVVVAAAAAAAVQLASKGNKRVSSVQTRRRGGQRAAR